MVRTSHRAGDKSRFYPGLRAAGVAEPGAEPTHPEGQKRAREKSDPSENPPLLRPNHEIYYQYKSPFASLMMPAQPITLDQLSTVANSSLAVADHR